MGSKLNVVLALLIAIVIVAAVLLLFADAAGQDVWLQAAPLTFLDSGTLKLSQFDQNNL